MLVRLEITNMGDLNEDYQSEDSFDLDKAINKKRDADRDSVDTLELLRGEFFLFFISVYGVFDVY